MSKISNRQGTLENKIAKNFDLSHLLSLHTLKNCTHTVCACPKNIRLVDSHCLRYDLVPIV